MSDLNRMMPTIELNLTQVKERIAMCFVDHNNEMSKRIAKLVEETITLKWVEDKLQQAVDECIEKAIEGIVHDYSLQRLLQESMIEMISNSIKSKRNEHSDDND